ncbi:MAG TPA: tetratricopeptide repeat protein [Opitutaceae bacterium]|nr:tetratricopeptide repeat protein [Opitutaceae bacterium]
MKFNPAALLRTTLIGLLFFATVCHAQQTLPERELKRAVERERVLLKATADNPMGIDRENVQMQLQEVVQDYERIIRDSPEFVPAYVAYGLLLNKVGERKRATEIFLTANKLDSRIAVVKNQLGNYCAEEGDFQDAMEYYLAAIALEPNEPLYHYQLGTLLHEYRDQFVIAGRLDMSAVKSQSATAFRKAVELAPDSIPYAYRQAESYYDAENPDWSVALAAWHKLRERVVPGIEQQTIDLHIANILIKQEKFADAHAVLSGVTDPSLSENRQTLVAQMPETP